VKNDNRNRILYLPFLLLLISFFIFCGSPENNSITNNILRVALFDNPTNLDPRTYSDVASYRIIEQIYDPLLRLDSTGTPQPVLARNWEISNDTVYTFKLHDNVFFHDGIPLTAYDVAFTFTSILDSALKAPSRKSFEVVDKITVIDSFTIKFKLKFPYAPFLPNIEMGIVPQHIARKQPDVLQRKPVGSGPFKFVEWKSDAFIDLAANGNYWAGPPELDGLLIKILPEATTRILALEYGEIDFLMNEFPESYLPRFQSNPDLKILKKSGSNYVYIGLNVRNQYLKNRKVRQAIAYAINTREIIDNLLGGIYEPAKSLLNPLHWAFNPNLPSYAYSPQKAKQLLDDAGFIDPDGDGSEPRFRLNYKCTDKQKSRQKGQIIQQYLKKVDIEIKIQSFIFLIPRPGSNLFGGSIWQNTKISATLYIFNSC